MGFFKFMCRALFAAFFSLLVLMVFVAFVYGILPAVFVGLCALLVICLLGYCSWQYDYRRKIEQRTIKSTKLILNMQQTLNEVNKKIAEMDGKIKQQQEEMNNATKIIIQLARWCKDGQFVAGDVQMYNGQRKQPVSTMVQPHRYQKEQLTPSMVQPYRCQKGYSAQIAQHPYSVQNGYTAKNEQLYTMQKNLSSTSNRWGVSTQKNSISEGITQLNTAKTYSVKAEIKSGKNSSQPEITVYRDGVGVFKLSGNELMPANIRVGDYLTKSQVDEIKAYEMYAIYEINSRVLVDHKIIKIQPAVLHGTVGIEKNGHFEGTVIRKGIIQVDDPEN